MSRRPMRRVNSEYSKYWLGQLTYKEHCYKTDQCSYCRSPPCEKPRVLSPGSWNIKRMCRNNRVQIGLLEGGSKIRCAPDLQKKAGKIGDPECYQICHCNETETTLVLAYQNTGNLPGNRIDIHEQGQLREQERKKNSYRRVISRFRSLAKHR